MPVRPTLAAARASSARGSSSAPRPRPRQAVAAADGGGGGGGGGFCVAAAATLVSLDRELDDARVQGALEEESGTRLETGYLRRQSGVGKRKRASWTEAGSLLPKQTYTRQTHPHMCIESVPFHARND